MDGIFLWLAVGFAGLLFVAVVVAWWEHLGRRPPMSDEPVVNHAPAVAVDVDLDRLPEGDVAARREALDNALERMTQPGALGAAVERQKTRPVWVDTAPMVGPGALPQPTGTRETAS